MSDGTCLDYEHGQFVSHERWPESGAEQKELLVEAAAWRDTGDPPIRWSNEATPGPNR